MPEWNRDFNLLSQAASFDQEEPDAGTSACTAGKLTQVPDVFKAKKSGGGESRLLKTLLTTACERNCNYCAFRAGRDFQRSSLSPDAMANTFERMHQAGLLDGLFLSSGIIRGGIPTQDKIIATAEILRRKYHYRGYIHLKLMPGAEYDQVKRSMELANRVSINLEAPNAARLAALAPKKHFDSELISTLKMVENIRQTLEAKSPYIRRWPSLATQLVVGAAGENDLEILSTCANLLTQLNLSRVYFSKFSPVQNTPLENVPAENPLRQLRLYQASFLLRDYGFEMEDFGYAENGNLPLGTDPKSFWARTNLMNAPIEINQATRVQLLKIPGIGPKGAQQILTSRIIHPIREVGDLRKLGINSARAVPYILLNGKRPQNQLSLW